MIALVIILVIIALLAVLFSIHIKAELSFSTAGDNSIELRYWFLKFKILPVEKKEKDDKRPEETADKPTEKKKPDIKKLFTLIKTIYRDLKDGLVKILGYVIAHAVTIYELNISAEFGLDDPAKTGMAFGAANAAVYNVIALIDKHTKLQNRSVSLIPDFENEGMRGGVYAVIGTNIWHILALGGIFAKTGLKILYKLWKMRRSADAATGS